MRLLHVLGLLPVLCLLRDRVLVLRHLPFGLSRGATRRPSAASDARRRSP